MNIFENESLAIMMRPKTLEDIVGQEHIIGKDKLLYRMIKADKLSSIILYGPPGTGKTTIAKVIANTTSANFVQVNATTSGKKDLEKVIELAKESNNKTILFIDEIHRFNKGQQDYLLSYVEDGTIVLIGATTENPYFEVNDALLSRSTIFRLQPLSINNMLTLINKVENKFNNIIITDEAKNFLVEKSDGDARILLNALELAISTTEEINNKINIDINVASECIQRRALKYDKNGNYHYYTTSALIESMRANDVNAALYYLARMLEAGEDIKFIARRIMISASEDVGNADPKAIEIATTCALAVERVGLPEAKTILSQAVIYVTLAPKSMSSYLGIENAIKLVEETGNLPIPNLKGGNSSYHLPEAIKDRKVFELSDIGYEGKLKNYYCNLSKNNEK